MSDKSTRIASLAELGEFGLIGHLSRLLPSGGEGVRLGIGDDTAAFQMGESTLLATADALLEGVHFRRDWTTPEDLGWKSLAVNLSDIAGMGGLPKFALLSLGLPADISISWLEGYYRGLGELSKLSGCAILGGDTVTSPDRIYLNISVIGEALGGRFATRSGAQPGDVLLVTGTLGDSLAGYYLLKEGKASSGEPFAEACLRAHHRPIPRLETGRAVLATGGIHAMMDVSDGLSGDVRHIAERSGVGFRIFEDRLPISPAMREAAEWLGRSPVELALQGGEDYELLMTVPPESVETVIKAAEETGVSLTPIGEATDRAGEIVRVGPDGAEEPLPRLSWDHFGQGRNE